jgi:hypothetical protein
MCQAWDQAEAQRIHACAQHPHSMDYAVLIARNVLNITSTFARRELGALWAPPLQAHQSPAAGTVAVLLAIGLRMMSRRW